MVEPLLFMRKFGHRGLKADAGGLRLADQFEARHTVLRQGRGDLKPGDRGSGDQGPKAASKTGKTHVVFPFVTRPVPPPRTAVAKAATDRLYPGLVKSY